MKYIKQLGIILGIACIGKGMRYLIPLPVPGSIYGLLLIMLTLKVIKLDCVEQTGNFFLGLFLDKFRTNPEVWQEDIPVVDL